MRSCGERERGERNAESAAPAGVIEASPRRISRHNRIRTELFSRTRELTTSKKMHPPFFPGYSKPPPLIVKEPSDSDGTRRSFTGEHSKETADNRDDDDNSKSVKSRVIGDRLNFQSRARGIPPRGKQIITPPSSWNVPIVTHLSRL